MSRRLLFAALLTVAALVPGSPAAAHTDACAFHGVMYTAGPPSTPLDSIPFYLATTLGTCVTSAAPFQATGDIVGFLALTTGTGVTDTGHRFAFTGTGGVVELTGEVVGILEIVPAQHMSGQNLVHGVVALVNA